MLGSYELIGRGASTARKGEVLGQRADEADSQVSVPQAFKKAIKNMGVYSPMYMLFLPSLHFLPPFFFFLSEITAPTLWIKHLVIKDSKLNNTNVRNSGK